MSSLALLKSAVSLSDVATLLGFKPASLSFVLYKQADAYKYQKFQIPKKTGGMRDICAPMGAMATAQRELADLLYICREEVEKLHGRKPLSHAYRKGLSIITNAQAHTSRRFVLNVDLQDFFPTFNFGRVRGFFIKDKSFALNEKVATVLAQIACYENSLPQGSPCSPIISDLMAHLLDVKLVILAKKFRVTYSRYADDLTFSTNQKTFPSELALAVEGNPNQWMAGTALTMAISAAGFKINPAKTRLQIRGSRQVVTGLTVNAKVNISQSYWRGIRSMCRSLYQTGEYFFPVTKAEVALGAVPEKFTRLEPLAGALSHAYHVKSRSNHLPDPKAEHVVFGHRDHARFWFFKTFVACHRPLILCEGVTDGIYLRNAMRQLSGAFPELAIKTGEGFQYGVSIFSYENLVHKILNITGGIGPIWKLVHGYKAALADYKFRPLAFPVIVLIDNDTVLTQQVSNALKKHFGIDISHASIDPFFHLTENLYLVKTPVVPGKPMSCIEDFFDPATLAMDLNGKTFHTEKKGFNPTLHIGKKPFATELIAPNAATISWAGFNPLLGRIKAAMDDYKTKAGAAI